MGRPRKVKEIESEEKEINLSDIDVSSADTSAPGISEADAIRFRRRLSYKKFMRLLRKEITQEDLDISLIPVSLPPGIPETKASLKNFVAPSISTKSPNEAGIVVTAEDDCFHLNKGFRGGSCMAQANVPCPYAGGNQKLCSLYVEFEQGKMQFGRRIIQ